MGRLIVVGSTENALAGKASAGGYDAFVRLFGPDLGALEAAWHRYEEDL